MSSWARIGTGYLSALLVAAWAGSGAQEPPAVPSAPPSATELSLRVDRASVRVREIVAAAVPEAALDTAAGELAEFQRELEGMHARLATIDLRRLSRRDFQDLRQEWVQERARLEEWIARTSERSRTLEKSIATLQAVAEPFSGTLGPSPGLPDSIVARSRALLDGLDRASEALRARRDRILRLLSQAEDARLSVDDALASIHAARPGGGRKLLERTDVPLWRLGEQRTARRPIAVEVYSSIDLAVRNLVRYARDRATTLVALAGLFFGLVAALVVLRRSGRLAEPVDSAAAESAPLLRRPVAAAALVTFVAAITTQADAPAAFFDLVGIALLVPLLRVLPAVVVRRFRFPLVGLAAIWLAQRVGPLLSDSSAAERLLNLAVSTIALAGLIYAVPGGAVLRTGTRGRWGTVARSLAWLWAAALGTAIAANVLGAVPLAEMLSSAALNAFYLALVLFGAVTTLDGLTRAALGDPAMGRLRFVHIRRERVGEAMGRAWRFAAIAFWSFSVLGYLRVWGPVRELAVAVFGHRFHAGALSISLGDIVAFVITLWVATVVSRILRSVLEQDVLTRVDLPRGIPETISMLVHYGVLTLGLLVAMAAAGFQVTQFAIVAGALGVGIGFGLQNVVNNFVSGLILIFERPIKLGDFIEVGTISGEVRNIGIRASTIRTYEGAEVIVPNGTLLSSDLVNWTLSDRRRRIEIPVGVAYGTDPRRVLELLVESVNCRPGVLQEPSPAVLFQGFGDSSLDFLVRFWTADFDRWTAVRSDAVRAVHAALRDAGIEIPFPQRDVHVRTRAAAFEPVTEPDGGADPRS